MGAAFENVSLGGQADRSVSCSGLRRAVRAERLLSGAGYPGMATRPALSLLQWAMVYGILLERLGSFPERQLVLVRYKQDHDPLAEWVYNDEH